MCILKLISTDEILGFKLACESHNTQLSQSLIHLLECFIGQPLLCKQTFEEVLLDSDLPFVCEVTSLSYTQAPLIKLIIDRDCQLAH